LNAGRRRRSLALGLLALLVALAHWWVTGRIAALLPEPQRPAIERLQAAFVREMQVAEPLAPAPAAPVAVRPRRAAAAAAPKPAASAPVVEPPAAAASAPEEAAAPQEPPMPGADTAPLAEAPVPEDLASSPPAAVAEAASAPGSPAFEWPVSTRLSYLLTGDVRGPVAGRAQVEWLRESDRYQVQVEVTVGPGFAPLMQRRMTSDGYITSLGLAPRIYEEETQIAFASPRRARIGFGDDEVTLSNGKRLASLPGVQDTASQLVQLTYLFATGAEPLRAGGVVEVPLALPRRLDRWIYDVIGEESLATPFGTLPAWHLLPRREGTPSTLSIETWFAPSLQYLPVRIVIRQGPDTYIDLMIERLPQQAGAPAR
jgi:hypothetical protein